MTKKSKSVDYRDTLVEREGKSCEVEILRDFICQINRQSSSYKQLNLHLNCSPLLWKKFWQITSERSFIQSPFYYFVK